MRLVTAVALASGMMAGAVHAEELDDVNAAFFATYPWECNGAFQEDGKPFEEPAVYDLPYRMSWQEPDEPDRTLRLYQYQCLIGAYNVGHVFFTVTEDGIRALQLAQPTISTIYAPGAEEGEVNDQKVEQILLTGMTTYVTASNAEVDAATGTIKSTSFWRGIGDASSAAEWRLVDGDFSLVRFDVDASYDGEVNPTTIWDTTEALASAAAHRK